MEQVTITTMAKEDDPNFSLVKQWEGKRPGYSSQRDPRNVRFSLVIRCGVSKVTMVTRHASQPLGTMIEFDTAGGIAAREAVAREVGTTISIQAIFQSLPVRR